MCSQPRMHSCMRLMVLHGSSALLRVPLCSSSQCSCASLQHATAGVLQCLYCGGSGAENLCSFSWESLSLTQSLCATPNASLTCWHHTSSCGSGGGGGRRGGGRRGGPRGRGGGGTRCLRNHSTSPVSQTCFSLLRTHHHTFSPSWPPCPHQPIRTFPATGIQQSLRLEPSLGPSLSPSQHTLPLRCLDLPAGTPSFPSPFFTLQSPHVCVSDTRVTAGLISQGVGRRRENMRGASPRGGKRPVNLFDTRGPAERSSISKRKE